LTTINAPFWCEKDLSFLCLALRVVTPPAAERAPFQKNGRSDAIPIIGRKPFDQENGRALH
jgi:hypothetical protein